MMWSERVDNHVLVYRNGEFVYKRWVGADGMTKTQPSILLNRHWPSVWIVGK